MSADRVVLKRSSAVVCICMFGLPTEGGRTSESPGGNIIIWMLDFSSRQPGFLSFFFMRAGTKIEFFMKRHHNCGLIPPLSFFSHNTLLLCCIQPYTIIISFELFPDCSSESFHLDKLGYAAEKRKMYCSRVSTQF